MDPLRWRDDDLVAVVAHMGAPLVGQERLTDPDMARAVTMMEEYLGRKFRAVMSVEIGGGNSLPALHGRRACWTCPWSTATAWGAPSPRRR